MRRFRGGGGTATRKGRRLRGTSWLAVGLLAGCAPAMPPEDATPRGRFDWSVDRFEREKYHDAIRGFRDHLLREPLHPTADSSRLLLAESYLATDQELLAANEFRQLATSRPNSPLADDAQFGVCKSYWTVSPDLPRDQARARIMETLKRALADGRAEIRRRSEERPSGMVAAHRYAGLVDEILRAIYIHVTEHVYPLANPSTCGWITMSG